MTKPKCCGEVVSNTVGGKDFYYCRGCKKEVYEKSLSTSMKKYDGPLVIPKFPYKGWDTWLREQTITYSGHSWPSDDGACRICGQTRTDLRVAYDNATIAHVIDCIPKFK